MAATALNRARTALPPAYVGTRSGLEYRLGQEVGSGGNGIVYAVARRPELVAKLQKYPLGLYDVSKLEALAQAATPDLLSVAAWPTDLLKDGHGQVVGFVMPRVLDARPLYELYSPRSRIQHFPSADFRFLVHAAANIARLFAAVHKAGFICGDVNHSNVLVRQSGTVAAVDCDSFQVGDGSRFPCVVGTDLFVPPELLGIDLGKTRRTANHDNFGLAVLIFHLLFMGRHPFAGRYHGSGEMPIETAIAESRFAYSQDTSRTRMTPPPFTPPVDSLGPAVTELFERAFHPDARSGNRPSPETWIDALDALKSALLPCKAVSWHYHARTVVRCPWCEIEQGGRVKLFGGLVRLATAGVADLDALWARYLALIEPASARVPPMPPTRSIWKRWRKQRAAVIRLPLTTRLAALVRGVLGFASRVRWDRLIPLTAGLVLVPLKYPDAVHAIAGQTAELVWTIAFQFTRQPLDTALFVSAVLVCGAALEPVAGLARRSVGHALLWPRVRTVKVPPAAAPFHHVATIASHRLAKRKWKKAIAAWSAVPAPPDVSDLKVPVQDLKNALDLLAKEREAAIQACAAPETTDAQLARFLGGYRIEDARLPNIGPARCSVLRSWGIDTAADIDEAKIAEIPGFGKGLTEKLVVWRDSVQAGFTPSTIAVVDPLDVQTIDRKLASRRTKLMKELRTKIAEVESRLAGHVKERDTRWLAVEDAYRALLSHT